MRRPIRHPSLLNPVKVFHIDETISIEKKKNNFLSDSFVAIPSNFITIPSKHSPIFYRKEEKNIRDFYLDRWLQIFIIFVIAR